MSCILGTKNVHIKYHQRTRDLSVLVGDLRALGLSVFEQMETPPGEQCARLIFVDEHTPDGLFSNHQPDLVVVTEGALTRCDKLLDIAPEFCALPLRKAELAQRLRRILGEQVLPSTDNHLKKVKAETQLLGSSPVHLQILKLIQRYAMAPVPVLIEGETGTGKELAARALHYLGERRPGPFQAINCGALPDQLLENELFGHARGAYTHAMGAQPGLVELAHMGTLFLDEIDSLSPSAQSALLRFLQNGCYRPLGAGKEKYANVRIVAATNKNLQAQSDSGEFRTDLLFRLNTLSLYMPALRKRPEDIAELSDKFLKNCSDEFRLGEKRLHPWTLDQMRQWHWPGNVRELQHFIQRAYLLCDQGIIIDTPTEGAQIRMQSLHGDGRGQSTVPGFNEAKHRAIERFEQDYLHLILNQTLGNISAAARLAGKERRSLGKLVKKYGIDCSSYASQKGT